MPISIQIASVPELEHVIVELGSDDHQLAEVRRENGILIATLYPRRDNGPVEVELSDFLDALNSASKELADEA